MSADIDFSHSKRELIFSSLFVIKAHEYQPILGGLTLLFLTDYIGGIPPF